MQSEKDNYSSLIREITILKTEKRN